MIWMCSFWKCTSRVRRERWEFLMVASSDMALEVGSLV